MSALSFEKWTPAQYKLLDARLQSERDEKYREFHSSLCPDSSKIIGVRIPALRGIAKEISAGNALSFLSGISPETYEQRIVTGFVIANFKTDFPDLIKIVDNFVDKVDSWAVCDTFCAALKAVRKNREAFLEYIKSNIFSENPWKVRVCLVLLLDYYIDDTYADTAIHLMDSVKNEEYYVMMAQAWLLSAVFVKYPDKTLEYMKSSNIPDRAFNKGISKIGDSFRVSAENKKKAKELKRKIT